MRRVLLLTPIVSCLKAAPPEDRITEISLERTPCLGKCPIDVLVLRSDGTADYFGKEHVARIGHFRGRFNPEDFARLSKVVASHGDFFRKAFYGPRGADIPGVETTVKRGEETTKVSHNFSAGPVELWAMEMAIRGVAADIMCEQVE